MKLAFPRAWLPALAVGAGLTLSLGFVAARGQDDVRLPSGKLQKDEILKAEHEANVKDVARLVEASQELQQEIEKNDRYVISISSLKKTDEIEKLIKKIRSRLHRN
jgi:hypothetical protein